MSLPPIIYENTRKDFSNHAWLDMSHAMVLADLSWCPIGTAYRAPENKYWHRAAADLIERGWVERVDDVYFLTDEGLAAFPKRKDS